jgi:DNA-binding response OmpR family regulator
MSGKLLLVEDEEHLAFTLEFNLMHEGYSVDVAPRLSRARSLLSNSYDLIVLDVMLPDGDGFSFCQSLRMDGNHTPVLFLTAKGTPDDVVQGLEAGGDDYVTKPFELKELLARIRAILRRHQWEREAETEEPELPETYEFGQTTVHFPSHTVSINGEAIELTALEFRLLTFFILHENQALRREDLLKEVWEVSASNTTRTIDNFLVRLRRLFEPEPSRPRHFLTVRGVGYRFSRGEE